MFDGMYDISGPALDSILALSLPLSWGQQKACLGPDWVTLCLLSLVLWNRATVGVVADVAFIAALGAISGKFLGIPSFTLWPYSPSRAASDTTVGNQLTNMYQVVCNDNPVQCLTEEQLWMNSNCCCGYWLQGLKREPEVKSQQAPIVSM